MSDHNETLIFDCDGLFAHPATHLRGRQPKVLTGKQVTGTFVHRSVHKPDIHINFGVRYVDKLRTRFRFSLGEWGFTTGMSKAAFIYALVKMSHFRYKGGLYNGRSRDLKIEVDFTCHGYRYTVTEGDAVEILRLFLTKAWATRYHGQAVKFDLTYGACGHKYFKWIEKFIHFTSEVVHDR